MRVIGTATLLAALTVALPARASVYFYNAGDIVGWSQLGPAENGGSIADSPIAFAGSGGSVESTCVYHGQDGTRYHSEPRWNGSWNTGTTYFGYALYVAPDWDFTGPERHVTAQFGIASGPGKVPDDYQHWIKNDLLQMGVNGTDHTFGTMTAGQWHTVITRFTYSTTGQGQIQGWFDGTSVFEVDGISVSGGSGDGEALWALGLYEADWFGGMVGPQTTRSVYNAKIAIGTTYADVDPSSDGSDAGEGSEAGGDSSGSTTSSSSGSDAGSSGGSSSGSSGGSSSGSSGGSASGSSGGSASGSSGGSAGGSTSGGTSSGATNGEQPESGHAGCACAVDGRTGSLPAPAIAWVIAFALLRRRRGAIRTVVARGLGGALVYFLASCNSAGPSNDGSWAVGPPPGGSSSGGEDASSPREDATAPGVDATGGSPEGATGGGTADDAAAGGEASTGSPEAGAGSACDAGTIDVNAPTLPEYVGPPVGPVVSPDCPGDPTAGWTEYQDTFAIEHPYNLMPSDRFSRSCGVDTFWVLSTDDPHAPGNTTAPRTEARFSTFTSGMKMWTADVLIDSGEKTVVMQCHTTTTGIGPAYIRVENGDLYEANGTMLMSNAIGKWFNMKVSVDHATDLTTVWINNCQKLSSVNQRGNTELYFKHGTYTCDQSAPCKDHYKNVHLYQK